MEDRFIGMFIGPKSSGKTVALASWAKAGPLYCLDFDGRIRGILGAPWIDMELRKNIEYEYFAPKERGMVNKLQQRTEAWQVMSMSGQFNYKTIVIDSCTKACLSMIQQALPMTHSQVSGGKQQGKFIGTVPMVGPEDYGFEANVMYGLIAFLKSIPGVNIIVTAHVVDRFGKADPDNPFSESIVIGEKLSLRDKIAQNITIDFDHIFRFDRRMHGNEERFYVRFRGDLATTAYSKLPTGEIDITGKNFYDVIMNYVKEPANA